ncbi:hypothetical protein SCHPADRAFT_938120 [Schizopora paradoxa]|uniref:Zn(2)-C6 fungal-type domain-containing protein n=1 Tax=Schizopora paradoxa TaxID=27342 RepID=A0A0H2RX72_9AGAM|nr:hypothetical protein SCHPADRAFT_938120 [Schizopora paradoxa]
MAAQNSTSLSSAYARSHASRTDKPKRARTKHACDECRRSQKRCDGQKPLCARCKANGTTCSYTPHKARNQCVCTGPDVREGHHHEPADVIVFNPDPIGSAAFHTGAFSTLNSSPEQLPAQAGLLTPSPTFATHDETQDLAFYSAGQQSNGYSMPAAQQFMPALQQPHQQFHNTHMQVHVQRNQMYSHRSHSVPNVSTTHTPVAHAPFISPPVISTTLPKYSFDQSPTSESFSSPYTAQDPYFQQHLDDSPASLYDNLMPTVVQEAGTGLNDFAASSQTPTASEANVNHSSYTFYPDNDRPAVLPTSSYEANIADQQFTSVDAHGQRLLHSHLYGAGSVSTSSPPSTQQDFYGSLLFHDDGVQANQMQQPTPSYYNNELVSNQYDLGMQHLHSSPGYQGSPLSQHENFLNSHTPSPNPPATPTDTMHPHSHLHPHVQSHLHHQHSYANDQGNLSIAPTSQLLRWPSSSPVTVHTGTPVLDVHTDAGSAVPSPSTYGTFEYPPGGMHGSWPQ